MWYRIFIVVILLVILWSLFGTPIEGFINTQDYGPRAPAPFRNHFNEPSKFLNFCLTKKPRGGGPYPAYLWWKYYHHPAHNYLYRNCDQYRCQSPTENGYTAIPGVSLVDGRRYTDPTHNQQKVSDLNFGNDCGYYENPIEFCNKHPEYELCPNHWIRPKHQVHRQKECSIRTQPKWQE